MAARRETVVVGGGAMGSATAWHLARRGRQVTLIERFGARHPLGASHGRSRNFNLTYVDPTYQAMLREAAVLWRELEDESGVPLLDLVGIANHGAGIARDLHEALGALGVRAAMLTPAGGAGAVVRHPVRHPGGPHPGSRTAGRGGGGRDPPVRDRSTRRRGPARHPGRLDPRALRRPGRGATPEEVYVADTVVVTVGAWTDKLLGASVALPRLVVTQEQPAHFAVSDPSAVWPGFNHLPEPGNAGYDYWYSQIYGTLTPGEGVKAGWHAVGPVMDPDARTFEPEPAQLAALQRYAREWLPGVDADALTAISCTYTSTDDTDFVLDRVGPVVVGAGFSGHGFKFVPTVGRILADLVEGTGRPAARFSSNRP